MRSRGRVVERDGQGAPLRMAGMLSDVDAAHREQERRLDDARLSGLVRRVNEIELLVRRDGSIAEVNDRALEAYGYSRRELLGLNVRDLRAPETLGEVSRQMLNAAGDSGARFETRHRRRDGTTFPVQVSSRPLKVGEEVYLHSLVRDLTQQRAAERSLRESEEKLLEATRLASLGTLAAGVAHEINNPLSWMRSSLSYALEQLGEGEAAPAPGVTPAELREVLGDALQGVRRIGEIVKAMQSLARPPDGEQAREVDARAELAEAIGAVGDELAEKATVSVDLPQGLPLVRAVPGELGRAFRHVLVNAAHAIPAGKAAENRITVAARAAGGELVIEIADTGQGMTAQVRERIFEPFFTTKPVGQGSGLGLAIARSIVEAARGRIEVESEVGLGSVFRMHLPAVDRAAVSEGDGAKAAPAGSSRGSFAS